MTRPVSFTHGGNSDDAATAALMRLAGRRPEPAPLAAARARAAVEAEWRRALSRRRARGPAWVLIAAAAALLAVGVWLRAPSPRLEHAPATSSQAFATLVRAAGPVRVTQPGLPSRPLTVGERLAAGAVVETSPGGGVAFQLQNGASVRIDAASRAVFEDVSRIALEHGRLYVDRVNTAADTEDIRVVTRSGIVREIGTQFEVTAAPSVIQVRVREGIVRIDGPKVSASIGRAQSMRIDSDGSQTRESIATHGPVWSWTENLASPFTIEGATLESFLQWVGRERGLDWQFTDAAAARRGTTLLHGSIEGLTPSQALEAVLPATGMVHQLRDGRLVVGLSQE